jgi:hypothetical protein
MANSRFTAKDSSLKSSPIKSKKKSRVRKGAKTSASASRNKTMNAGDSAIVSKSRQRQKLLRIAEAMREEGLDEPALARTYLELLEILRQGKELTGSEKLLLDLLKELARTLEPQGSSGNGADSAPDSPMVVQLVHDVPRPLRTHAADVTGEHSLDAQDTR